jgi:type I restriction enzyme S subunit
MTISIALPTLTEQQAIADYLDKKCGDIDALIAIKQQKIESLKEYKKSIIYEYVTGKKEVE